MKTINDKLATIQTKFKSKKSRFNSFGKYYFRSAEDILEATKPYLLETTATISDGENAMHATAIVGVDMNQKGMQMPQKFGSASSYGKKYALGNLFLIDDTADADASNTHGVDWLPEAKKYLKNGGTMDAIKKKYKVTADIEKQLTTL